MIQLRVGSPCIYGAAIVIPIERVTVKTASGPLGPWLSAAKEPVAIVICDHDGCRAVDMAARRRPIDEFAREIPDLAQLIQQCRAHRWPEN